MAPQQVEPVGTCFSGHIECHSFRDCERRAGRRNLLRSIKSPVGNSISYPYVYSAVVWAQRWYGLRSRVRVPRWSCAATVCRSYLHAFKRMRVCWVGAYPCKLGEDSTRMRLLVTIGAWWLSPSARPCQSDARCGERNSRGRATRSALLFAATSLGELVAKACPPATRGAFANSCLVMPYLG